MRTAFINAFQRFPWPNRLALLVLGIYLFLAWSAQFGASVAGQGLDPVWAAAHQRGFVRIGTDFGYAPFTGIHSVTVNGQTSDEPFGYDIDLARAIAQKLGLDVQFVPTTLESAYETIASDQADMIISALPYAPEQGWRASFTTFYFNAGQVLVVRDDSAIQSADQLNTATVAVALGSDADTFGRNLVERTPGLHLRSNYDTPAEALMALRRGVVDAAIVDNAAAQIAINSAPGLRFVPPALTLEPYTIAVSTQAYLLRDQTNAALETLRNEGFFERNGARWFHEGAW